jgi:hypothetical protein
LLLEIVAKKEHWAASHCTQLISDNINYEVAESLKRKLAEEASNKRYRALIKVNKSAEQADLRASGP